MICTGARRQYPQFDNLTTDEWTELLRLSKLSPRQKEMATQCVQWRDMAMIEIAEAHGIDRRTLARMMDREILPELERMLKHTARSA